MIDAIAIPSHKRAKLLREKTVSLLLDSGILGNVTADIFLSDKNQAREYEKEIKPIRGLRVIPPDAPIDYTQKLNWIHNYYPVGSRVVVIEDDISCIVKPKGNKLVVCNLEFPILCQIGFDNCIANGNNLWGIYPSSSAMYMKDRITINQVFIPGFVYGFVSTHDESLAVTLPVKQDYERSAKYIMRYGSVTRLDGYSVRTNSYTAKGGLQELGVIRKQQEEFAVSQLLENYPFLFLRNYRRNSKYPEIKMRATR